MHNQLDSDQVIDLAVAERFPVLLNHGLLLNYTLGNWLKKVQLYTLQNESFCFFFVSCHINKQKVTNVLQAIHAHTIA